MNKQEFIDVLGKVPEIEQLLTPIGGDFMPDIKMLYSKEEFQEWKAELKYQLLGLEQKPLIADILHLLETGFNNGYTDEKDFGELKGKLNVISSHIDDYFPSPKQDSVPQMSRLGKGTIINTAFDKYTLIKQVGSGGNGRVFSAKNKDGEYVAIKFVEKNISRDKLKRFKNEIYFCEHHKHKNIVEIYDHGYAFSDDTEYAFYVMPLYSKTLRDKMKDKISPNDAIEIFIGIIEGLSYAHRNGTIHRDIKPENIMFNDNCLEPIICDFGIAHFAADELLTMVETKKGDRMANFQYAAPEQRVKGGQVTAQTDIYAAALILNEMFTGEIPQAVDYKTIGFVCPEYKFLDDVFVQLFKQTPTDRLYPEEKILTEIKIRAELYKREQEQNRLQNTVNDLIDPGNFETSIIAKEYRDGSIVFTMDKEIPGGWYEILTTESFSHTAMLGYEPHHLRRGKKNELCMRLRGRENESTVKNIVSTVSEWIPIVNRIYSERLKRNAEEEQRKKESDRKATIEKLERENKLASLISNL